MVRAYGFRMTHNDGHFFIVRLGLMNASLVGVVVLRPAMTSVELRLRKALMMKMSEITTIY
jgi:uncharacterized protein YceH (UPF0502 family)